jgi:predicted nucleotidyltransferase
MGTEPLRIDILNAIEGVEFDEVYQFAEEYEDDGIKMKVIHINHLIKNKKAVGRPKDLADVRALEKILNKKK